MKPKETESLNFDNWHCIECDQEFERPEFFKHLQEVHKLDTKTLTGKRKITMHLDGRNWFQTNYEWEIAGLKFTQNVRCERAV